MPSANPLDMLKSLPPVVKNLLIINVLMFVLTIVLQGQGIIDLQQLLSLYYPVSENFKPFQMVSHMFMHADFMHLAFNMYGLYLFGLVTERMLGSKKMLIYYLICGFGSMLFALAVKAGIGFQALETIFPDLSNLAFNNRTVLTEQVKAQYILSEGKMLGASGAIYGLLMAFAYVNPNRLLQFILFVFELLAGLNNNFLHILPSTGFAHFAHLGGLVFGYILMKVWKIPSR